MLINEKNIPHQKDRYVIVLKKITFFTKLKLKPMRVKFLLTAGSPCYYLKTRLKNYTDTSTCYECRILTFKTFAHIASDFARDEKFPVRVSCR